MSTWRTFAELACLYPSLSSSDCGCDILSGPASHYLLPGLPYHGGEGFELELNSTLPYADSYWVFYDSNGKRNQGRWWPNPREEKPGMSEKDEEENTEEYLSKFQRTH